MLVEGGPVEKGQCWRRWIPCGCTQCRTAAGAVGFAAAGGFASGCWQPAEEISKAQADVEAAHIDAENAESIYQRQKELVEQHFVAKQQADNARAAADAAQAKYHALQQTLKLVQMGPRKEDIAAAKATLQASQAALDVARKAPADASLYAPETASSRGRILEPGDMASPRRPVYTLALTDPIWVRAYVQGSDLGKLKPGMRAEVHRQLSRKKISRLGRLHFTDCGVHAQVGGDHRSAQQSGLSGAHLRVQSAGRAAPRHACNRDRFVRPAAPDTTRCQNS